MVDQEQLQKALNEIVEKRNALAEMDYSDEGYDDAEDDLHDMEDDFNEEFGEFLEEIFAEVHETLCPDNDVLLPTAYLANKYVKEDEMEDGEVVYNLGKDAGVCVEVDDYINKDTRLVLLPGPPRIWLIVNGVPKEQLWSLN